MESYIQAAVAAGTFVIGAVGFWIIRELRIIHKRIDKYGRELDEHVRESVKVHVDLALVKQKLGIKRDD